MGKTKDAIKDDASALAEWVARKIINHTPMSGREKGKAKIDRRAPISQTPAVRYDANAAFYLLENGKRFRIVVEEMGPDEYVPPMKRVLG